MNRKTMEFLTKFPRWIWIFLRDHLGKVSAHTLGWFSIILCHFAAIPTLISVLMAQNDKLPPVDLMLFVWSSLIAMFFKAMIEKNFLYVSTICIGFVAQTVIMSLILFK
jgi:hypothetical protein